MTSQWFILTPDPSLKIEGRYVRFQYLHITNGRHFPLIEQKKFNVIISQNPNRVRHPSFSREGPGMGIKLLRTSQSRLRRNSEGLGFKYLPGGKGIYNLSGTLRLSGDFNIF